VVLLIGKQKEHQMADYHFTVGCSGYSRRVNTEDGPVEQWVETFQVEASTVQGRRWVWEGQDFSNVGTVKSIMRHLDLGNPETSPRWVEVDPVYGSDAWGPEDEFNLACFEADCYGEPRPRWA
jgi:hypothetical protein